MSKRRLHQLWITLVIYSICLGLALLSHNWSAVAGWFCAVLATIERMPGESKRR